MIETCTVAEKWALPAITHVDGTARVQTISMQSNSFLARLLRKFYARTGCPVLLNTSFNLAGEPIVCSVQDSLRSFIKSELDILVINDFVVDRKNVSMHSRNFVLAQSSRHRAYHWDVYSLLWVSKKRWLIILRLASGSQRSIQGKSCLSTTHTTMLNISGVVIAMCSTPRKGVIKESA